VLIEIGKTYLNRLGERITIEYETTSTGTTNQFAGFNTRREISHFSARGRFTRRPHHFDLIKEDKPDDHHE
jgi:hypothetical protein